MNEAIGIVSEIRGSTVVVEVDAAACPRCQAGQGCGAGIFTSAKRRVSMTVPVQKGLGLFAYGLPLSALLLACGIASLSGQSELATIAWGAAGLAIGFAAGGWSSRRKACLSSLRPTVRDRAEAADTELPR